MADRSNTKHGTRQVLTRALKTTGKVLSQVCEEICVGGEVWDHAERRVEDLRKRISETDGSTADANARWNDAMEEVKRRLGECTRIVSDLAEEKKEIVQRRKWLQDVSESCSVLEEKLNGIGGMLDKGAERTRSAVSRTKQVLEAEKGHVVDLDRRLAAQSQSIDGIENDVDKVRTEAREARRDTDGADAADVELAQLNELLEAAEREKEQLHKELEHVRREASEARSRVDKIALQSEEVSVSSSAKEAENAALEAQERAQSLESDLAKARTKLEEARSRAREAESRFTSELSSMRKERELLFFNLKEAWTEAEGLKSREMALAVRLDELEAEVFLRRGMKNGKRR